MPNYLFKDSALTVIEDGTDYVVNFAYNPETQQAWGSEQEAIAYTESVPLYFSDTTIPPERLASEARDKRNQLLAASDWTQGKDIPDVVSTTYAVYRKALRELPEQKGFPIDITYPVNPAEPAVKPAKKAKAAKPVVEPVVPVPEQSEPMPEPIAETTTNP